eukprot:4340819-Pyramimonas_sp.AAC.1
MMRHNGTPRGIRAARASYLMSARTSFVPSIMRATALAPTASLCAAGSNEFTYFNFENSPRAFADFP